MEQTTNIITNILTLLLVGVSIIPVALLLGTVFILAKGGSMFLSLFIRDES